MRALGLALLALLSALPARAGTLSGQVEVLKKSADGPLDSFADAVVWLEGGAHAAPAAEPARVAQLDKLFQPRVLAIPLGTEVEFVNRDAIDHNVYAAQKGAEFDLGRYPMGQHRGHVFNEAGFFRVYCNIHQAMILDVVVLDTPYFAITGDDGAFTLPDVPPGDYMLKVWHKYGGESSQPLSVTAADQALGRLSVTSTKVVREVTDHLDKHGRPYRPGAGGGDY